MCEELPQEGCGSCATCRKIENENHEDCYFVKPDGEEGKGTLSIKVAAIEELQKNLSFKPTAGDRNIAIIQNADAMTVQAQNRFLKTLEEPAAGTVILLLVENADNLLQTIRSRAMIYRLYDTSRNVREGMRAQAEEVLQMIAEKAFFFDLCNKLDEILKTRQDGLEFLDGMEFVLGDWIRHGSSYFRRAQMIHAVECVEKARRALQTNGNLKYVIRNLVLKLEDNK